MCIPFPRNSFSACWLLDVAKHPVDVHVGVDVGVSASATRASFLFLSKLLPRKNFLRHFYPLSLPPGRFFSFLFAIDREPSSSFAFLLPPSSKAFRRVWETCSIPGASKSAEASAKEHGNAFLVSLFVIHVDNWSRYSWRMIFAVKS